MTSSARIDLSLISHTNVGKTTLARTLLRRDIGEVGDRAHVTDIAESDVLIESTEGDSLVLWDTPGFGDSGRLLRRLQHAEQPFGWFLAQVWDRLADRPFWCGQQAMRIARDSSDVVLYVGNASEGPASAAYVDIEMQILAWLKKPVILLLNQLGPPRDATYARAELREWETYAVKYPCVRAVLPFDAFARCWVQEGTLLAHVQRLLPEEKRAAFERLRGAWKRRNLEVFEQSMQVLARQVAAIAVDIESLANGHAPSARAPAASVATAGAATPGAASANAATANAATAGAVSANASPANAQGKARAWFGAAASAIAGAVTGAIGGADRDGPELERAQRALATRLDHLVRTATEELVRLHGLSGKAAEEVLQRMGHEFSVQRAADAGTAGVLGGLVSGALGGLAADLGAGGLTFGAGAVIGGVLGAFGARGLAKAYNLARGSEAGTVRWSSEFLSGRLAAALMRYLAVAHFGRGRGDFIASATPTHWREAVEEALNKRRGQIETAWATSRAGTAADATATAGGATVTAGGATATAGSATATAGGVTATAGSATATAGGVTATAGGVTATAADATAAAVLPIATASAREALARLYPDSSSMLI